MRSEVATTVFKVSDLAASDEAFSNAARGGRVRLEVADGTSLAVLPEDELLALTEIVRWAMQHLRIESSLHKPAARRSATDFEGAEWLGAFDDDDLATFLDELGVALLSAAGQHSTEELHQLLADWRTTADVLADPEDRDILLGTYEDSDFVEVHRPE